MSNTNNYFSLINRLSGRVVDQVFFCDKSAWVTKAALEQSLERAEKLKEEGTKVRVIVWNKSRWPEMLKDVKEVGELNRAFPDDDEDE